MSEETDEKYELWVANQQKLFATIARIETKLSSLTQKYSRQAQSTSNEVTLIKKMKIIESVEELDALEEKLKSEEYMRNLVKLWIEKWFSFESFSDPLFYINILESYKVTGRLHKTFTILSG